MSKTLVSCEFVPVPKGWTFTIICVKEGWHNRCVHVKSELYLVAFNEFLWFSSTLLSFRTPQHATFILTLENSRSVGEGSPRMKPRGAHHTSLEELRFLRACLAHFYLKKKIYSGPGTFHYILQVLLTRVCVSGLRLKILCQDFIE